MSKRPWLDKGRSISVLGSTEFRAEHGFARQLEHLPPGASPQADECRPSRGSARHIACISPARAALHEPRVKPWAVER